jgi:4-carboxymuconolactone decarboxylase
LSRQTIRFIVTMAVLSGAMLRAQDRMPQPPAEQLSAEQQKASATVAPQGPLPVYLVPLLRSPEVMLRVNALGDYVVRGKTALSRKQSELVILLVIRDWSQRYMWSNHYQAAIRAGVSVQIADAIGDGRRPERLADDERALYDFCTELQEHRSVSDPTYARMVAVFGEAGVVDTLGLVGYYTMLSMTFNAARTPITEGGAVLKTWPNN